MQSQVHISLSCRSEHGKSRSPNGLLSLPEKSSDRNPDPFFGEMQEVIAKGFTNNMVVDDPDERPVLPLNTAITTRSNKYIVIKKLGAGGFGDVYEVHRERDSGVLAMKTEFDVDDDMLQRLKVI
ncbi:unnamed protein product [Nippostrongylus brasiliensis]|uniref:Protein kinase domain-containing protein n=1 Tax=Nippostrongylus brasiliensis TaxID=27835 RepID=A0A0N4XX21_NIPBR|nr:unnamed protein product [Nippostrongylus brasiliensis]